LKFEGKIIKNYKPGPIKITGVDIEVGSRIVPRVIITGISHSPR